MGGLSFWHLLVVALLALLLFGRGRISDLMGDVAKGIKSFKKGLADEDPAPKALPSERADATPQSKADDHVKS